MTRSIASLSAALPDRLLGQLVVSIASKMGETGTRIELRRTYIQTLSAISRSGGYRLGKQLEAKREGEQRDIDYAHSANQRIVEQLGDPVAPGGAGPGVPVHDFADGFVVGLDGFITCDTFFGHQGWVGGYSVQYAEGFGFADLIEVSGVDEKFHAVKVAHPNGLLGAFGGCILIKSTEMANWTEAELAEFERRVANKLEILDERIEEYRELTKPIPPENAIGRVSRMDAINNRSVNEAALNNRSFL